MQKKVYYENVLHNKKRIFIFYNFWYFNNILFFINVNFYSVLILKLVVKILYIMDISNQLTLEQEFELVLYKQKIDPLNLEQAQNLLVETLKTMMLKDNIIKYVVKNSHFR